MRGELKEHFIEPNQEWKVDLFIPKDAAGVVRLFQMVYGDGYPVKTFTEADRLIEENAARRTISSVARTTKGDIVGHCALYCSAPYRGLLESGAGLVAPNYRGSVIASTLGEHSLNVARQFCIGAVFAEPVCNHVMSQKMLAKLGLSPTALEVDLMPAETYTKEASAAGRVATLLMFDNMAPKPQTIYVPTACRKLVHFAYQGIKHECRFLPCVEDLPREVKTRVDTQIYDFAKVARITVQEAGEDFEQVFDVQEKAAIQKGTLVHQVLLKLSSPWVDRVTDLLHSRGYFIGGVLPRWFDGDALLIQKISGPPHWEGIKLFSERASSLLQIVKEDWKTTQKHPT